MGCVFPHEDHSQECSPPFQATQEAHPGSNMLMAAVTPAKEINRLGSILIPTVQSQAAKNQTPQKSVQPKTKVYEPKYFRVLTMA